MPFVPLPLSVHGQIAIGSRAIHHLLGAGCIPARRDAPTGALAARNFASAAALVLSAAAVASAQSPPPFDLNHDGVPDSVLRQVRANPAEPVWSRIVVQSGAGGGEILSVVAPEANDLFGWVAASIGDIDGDGIADLAVSAPRGRTPLPGSDPEAPPDPRALGRVHLISGADGAILRSIGSTDFGYFGFALRPVADYDGDGLGDLLVGGLHATGTNPESDAVIMTHYWILASTSTGALLMQGEGSIGAPFRPASLSPRTFWRLGVTPGPRSVELGLSADLDADGDVDFADLLWLLAHWGTDPDGPRGSHPDLATRGDIDASGAVAFPDMMAVLEQFGRTAGDPSAPSPARHHCWDYCSCHTCEVICPDDMECDCPPPCGGGCNGSPCCGDPCCEAGGDSCSPACCGPCCESCSTYSLCACEPFASGCESPYPGDTECQFEDPCDCNDDGDLLPNRDDPDSPCFERYCQPNWTSIGRLVVTIPASIRLEFDRPSYAGPEDPMYTPVIWTNTDDDNQNGAPDHLEMGPLGSEQSLDFEEDLVPVQFKGTFCGSQGRWRLQSSIYPNPSEFTFWYDAGSGAAPDPDLRSQVWGTPWPESQGAERRTGGRLLRRIWLNSDGTTPEFIGSPKEWSGKIFLETPTTSEITGDKELVLYYSAVPNAGGQRKVKAARLWITAVELEVHDLQAWDPRYNPLSGTVWIDNTDFDSEDRPARPVGGATTDGASICLLRLKAPTDAHAEPLHYMNTWILKRKESSAQSAVSPTAYESPREVAGYVTEFQHGYPALPNLPMQAGDFSEDILGALDEGTAFYVPPEAYTDPAYLPPPPPGTSTPASDFLNSGETCLMTLRCTLGDGRIPGGRSFVLRRPPIVLVHGILSGPDTWDYEYWNELGTPVPTRLYKADYSETNKKGFPENYPKVVQMIDNALQEYRNASDAGHAAERRFHGIKYAATRADVVGHSQGGQLVRWYIADTSSFGTSISRGGGWLSAIDNYRAPTDSEFRWPYLRADNFGAGSIRRFVAMNSPFRGSPVANGINHNAVSPTLTFGNPIAKSFVGGDPVIDYVIDEVQATNEPTCLADLAAGSQAYAILRTAIYPNDRRRVLWHPVSTRVRDEHGNDPPDSWRYSSSIDRLLTKQATSAQQSLRTDNSDWVVSVCSQLNLAEVFPGPCLPGPGSFLQGIPHSSRYVGGALMMRGPPASSAVRNAASQLLSSPSGTSLFSSSWSLGQ